MKKVYKCEKMPSCRHFSLHQPLERFSTILFSLFLSKRTLFLCRYASAPIQNALLPSTSLACCSGRCSTS